MKAPKLVVALTVINLIILALTLTRTGFAAGDNAVPVLRGRALEIVDDHGRVRASIAVLPADPSVKMPDGTQGYPESVLLRLVSAEGRPNVKLSASEDGSGFVLGGESNPTHIQLLARGANTSLKLVNKDAREHVLRP